MAQTFHRNRFTWLAYLLLAYYGYFLNVLGPITPFLKSELSLSYTVSSLHFTAFATGILLVGLGGHQVIERLGRWHSLWTGAIGMSLSALLLIWGKIPVITIGASFLMGLIGSLILAIIPATLAETHGEGRAVAISEANVVASLVATAAPLLVGWFSNSAGTWRLALAVVAVAPPLLYLAFGKGSSISDETTNQKLPGNRQPLPTLYWIYWLAIVLAVSVEFCMISWSADFLENVLGMMKASAAQSVSLFFGAMILGRWAGSRLVQRFDTTRLVAASILTASLGFGFFWQGGSVLSGLAGLFLTGLGVASLYPLILSLAIESAGENTIQASARATLASGTAILALPLVLGRLADAAGIAAAYGVVVFLLAGVFLIIVFAGRTRSTQPVSVN
ncbi:MAG TPA: MFS transporter [Anaerolineales bacterium]